MTSTSRPWHLERGFFADGQARAVRPVGDVVALQLNGTDDDTAQVKALLQRAARLQAGLASSQFCMMWLSYEAQVALQGPQRLWPRHPPRAAHGPDVVVCVVEETAWSPTALAQRPGLSTTSKAHEAHLQRVAQCREALYAGTLYQANLAHPLVVAAASADDGEGFYAAQRRPPYSALVHVDGFSLVSLSPECFFKVDLRDRWARAYPIKGTVPRGQTPADDEHQRRRLEDSAKDAAEHVMIVDLLRNDLGRVARPGGVTVEELLRVVEVENVFHLESVVRGDLADDVGLVEVLSALSPGGSITGAPKSAAVEVIHQLEPAARGPYTGTLGVVDAAGRGAFNILIRSWLRPDGVDGRLHVGGGIVVDSTPAQEWQETLDKAAAFGIVNVKWS